MRIVRCPGRRPVLLFVLLVFVAQGAVTKCILVLSLRLEYVGTFVNSIKQNG